LECVHLPGVRGVRFTMGKIQPNAQTQTLIRNARPLPGRSPCLDVPPPGGSRWVAARIAVKMSGPPKVGRGELSRIAREKSPSAVVRVCSSCNSGVGDRGIPHAQNRTEGRIGIPAKQVRKSEAGCHTRLFSQMGDRCSCRLCGGAVPISDKRVFRGGRRFELQRREISDGGDDLPGCALRIHRNHRRSLRPPPPNGIASTIVGKVISQLVAIQPTVDWKIARDDPFLLHRSSTVPTLPADDDPIDAGEIDSPEVFQQRLNRQKPHGDISSTKVFNPWQAVLPIFDADAPPDMSRVSSEPQLRVQQHHHAFRTFGENLKRMPISLTHDLDDSDDVVVWHSRLEEVAH